jgi:N-acetylglucosaminyl-diphospho-decaprenol L-rhamnosyltransferase
MMDREPRVDIVVASRNRRALLLASVQRHLALPERPRIVVVDNASEDGTAAALAEGFPQIGVIALSRNAGAAGRNLGVEACDTPYVALTDDDAWWRPGALRRAADLLDADPRLALVQARILVGSDERDDPTCVEMAASPLRRADGQAGHPLLSFVACAVVVRREAFLAVGGFPKRLAVGGEEELVGWDLAATGWHLSYVPDVVAHHHPPPGSRHRPERREIQLRNALWTNWLRRPPATAASQTVRCIKRQPRDRITVRGIGRAAAGLPWVLRERRVNPPHVEALLETLEGARPAGRAPRAA